jgi:hypothetical protein
MGDPVTAGMAASALGGTGMVSAGALPGIVGGMGALAPAINPVSASLFSGMSMPSTIMGLGKDISALNTFMNQNPVTSRLGMQVASDLMQGAAPIQMPGGVPVSRGQIQPADFMSLLNPQQSQVIRPQSISLLG